VQLGQQPLDGVGGRRPGRQVQPGGEHGELVSDEHRLFGVDLNCPGFSEVFSADWRPTGFSVLQPL
jgi:hypothetical protein